ncbi:MAG: hypothetical protein R3C45_00315 [Phycisphaerales bacterium]
MAWAQITSHDLKKQHARVIIIFMVGVAVFSVFLAIFTPFIYSIVTEDQLKEANGTVVESGSILRRGGHARAGIRIQIDQTTQEFDAYYRIERLLYHLNPGEQVDIRYARSRIYAISSPHHQGFKYEEYLQERLEAYWWIRYGSIIVAPVAVFITVPVLLRYRGWVAPVSNTHNA